MTACKSNLKNVGTALEMYSTDNEGVYPASLPSLMPQYLKTVPTCPSARKDTYSASYASHSAPDFYTFFCGGQNHLAASTTANYPQFSSRFGLIER